MLHLVTKKVVVGLNVVFAISQIRSTQSSAQLIFQIEIGPYRVLNSLGVRTLHKLGISKTSNGDMRHR
jgi:hypothetical protein